MPHSGGRQTMLQALECHKREVSPLPYSPQDVVVSCDALEKPD
jgi:hypothetical protein